MRHTYAFVEKHGSYKYDQSTQTVLTDHINTNRDRYFEVNRGIEEQSEIMAETVANLLDLLISKGLVTPKEFLQILGLEDVFDIKQTNDI